MGTNITPTLPVLGMDPFNMNNDDVPQATCPKCHASLPDGLYESPGSICPSCGLVFEKYRAAQNPAYQRFAQHHFEVNDNSDSWLSVLLAVPENISSARFYTNAIGFVFFLLWGGSIATFDYHTGAINQSFLHGVLLIFHEAGHVIFRLFGEFATVVGGTLAQLLMPILLLVALLRHNHDTLGASLAFWLLGISLLDVAPYVYDAFDLQLVLLNGATGEDGGHDWIYILSELSILQHARTLGGAFYGFGILTLVVATVWAAVLLRRQWQVLKTTKPGSI